MEFTTDELYLLLRAIDQKIYDLQTRHTNNLKAVMNMAQDYAKLEKRIRWEHSLRQAAE